MSHPHGGDQSLVMTPSAQLIDSLTERFGADLFRCGRRMRIAPPRAQWLASAFYQGRVAGDAADACLLQFFESIASNDTRPRPLKDETLVRRALDYVHHTPERELTLQHVAAALQVGPSYLTHAFSRHMGQPLYRYIVRLKLSRALLRIVAGTEDLTQIALDLGFSSHSHLSAAFKARYGRSPSSTRRDHATQTHEVGASELQWRPLCVARGGIH
jgi:AraC-like DNA-binding protein